MIAHMPTLCPDRLSVTHATESRKHKHRMAQAQFEWENFGSWKYIPPDVFQWFFFSFVPFAQHRKLRLVCKAFRRRFDSDSYSLAVIRRYMLEKLLRFFPARELVRVLARITCWECGVNACVSPADEIRPHPIFKVGLCDSCSRLPKYHVITHNELRTFFTMYTRKGWFQGGIPKLIQTLPCVKREGDTRRYYLCSDVWLRCCQLRFPTQTADGMKGPMRRKDLPHVLDWRHWQSTPNSRYDRLIRSFIYKHNAALDKM